MTQIKAIILGHDSGGIFPPLLNLDHDFSLHIRVDIICTELSLLLHASLHDIHTENE